MFDNNIGSFEGFDFGVGIIFIIGDDGIGVIYVVVGGSRDIGNERDNGFVVVDGVVLFEEVGSFFFGGIINFIDYDDIISFVVFEEDFEVVDEVGVVEGVIIDIDDEGLIEISLGGLVDGFVGEGIGFVDDIDVVVFVNEIGYDVDFVLIGSNDIGVVGVY